MKKQVDTSEHLSVEHIQSYLAGTLEEAQRYQLEHHLLDCPLCSDAVEGFANQHNIEEDQHLAALQAQFSNTALQVPLPTRRLYFNQIAAAAAVLVLLTAAALFWQNSSDERLYRAFHQPFQEELIANARSGDPTAKPAPLLQEALEYYEAKDYDRSLVVFEQYLNGYPEDTKALFLAALAQIEMGQQAGAIDRLMTVRINDEQLFEDASWYMILAHVRSGERERAKQLLEELTQQKGGYYEQQAQNLLERLGK
ncbi:MAG: tetratricopeptide repeat protein [Bacteroidota bacterium]